MIFKFKEKPVVLDAFTTDLTAAELYAPQQASSFMPSWWKKLPFDDTVNIPKVDTKNMKSCPGFINIYKTGFIFPHASDVHVELKKPDTFINDFELQEVRKYKAESNIFFMNATDANAMSHTETHPLHQHRGWKTSTHLNLKINPPWKLRCKDYVKFLLAPVFYADFEDDLYELAAGIIDFKYNHALNLNLMVKTNKEKEFVIPAGRPAMHLIPLTEKKVELKIHHVTPAEMDKEIKLYYNFNKFRSGYIKAIKQLEGKL